VPAAKTGSRGFVIAKTNAARLLDRLSIRYELRAYPEDADDLSAARLSPALGLAPERIWKTLLARGDRSGPMFAVIPLTTKLDLKALAALAGDKRADLVPLSQVQPLTGYVRGAVTSLAAKKSFPVFMDARCRALERFGVSAGAPGLELLLSPADYLTASGARVGEIAVLEMQDLSRT
jgi:Cys-tRNA(Pro)/Cys-tRNA(Cys) deacylase